MIVSTNRLILREWNEKDAPFLFLLNSDLKVLKYTGDIPFISIKQAQNFINRYDHYEKFGYGRWICELRETGESIGWAGLKNQMDEEGIIDIGFRFLRKYWNKGYGSEAALACLKYGFEELNLSKITGRAAEENAHSHTILKKIGLKEENERKDCHGIKAIYYSLTLSEFEKLSH